MARSLSSLPPTILTRFLQGYYLCFFNLLKCTIDVYPCSGADYDVLCEMQGWKRPFGAPPLRVPTSHSP
eukprot:2006926-Amphidinium_carterae.1